jgi:O-methyltransferase
VYRGELAAILNRLFPDRTLYLFDTFEGFSQNDLSGGQEGKHSRAAVGDFQDTSLDMVLSRMASPERVIIRKGYFPATTDGLDDSFAFVSLDVDLYKPTMTGLNYFYPRLAKGGSFSSTTTTIAGIKACVAPFEEFVDATAVPLVQLPDFAGTAILIN